MLRQRVITAVVLVAVVLGAITGLSREGFLLFVAAVLAVGAWEWSSLLRLRVPQRLLYLGIFVGLMGALYLAGPAWVLPLMIASAIWWMVAFVLVIRYPAGSGWWHAQPVALVLGVVVLVPSLAALDLLRAQPGYVAYILMFIALVAAADIGAYFTGRTLGRRKLAPAVSPNKTWEGVFGGVAGTLLVGLVALALSTDAGTMPGARWGVAIAGCLALATYSVVGDLFESMLKRHCDAKDSSNLLPGHGGVLDRLDSLTAALPVYVLALSALGLM